MAFEPVDLPWLETRTLFDGEGLLVVDKPSRVVVHGGNVALGEDLITRLREWLHRRGVAEPYLGVHQRLDKEASGVLLFTRSPDRNADVARAFGAHDLERVYVAVVQGQLPAEAGELVHLLAPHSGARTQVVRTGGLRAETSYRVLRRRGARALVELRPRTGRTHQLRVQLAEVGAPIAGDRLYGGAPASRLLLHATSLGILGRRFHASVPDELEDWLHETETLGSRDRLAATLTEAAWRRQPLASRHTAFRLVNEQPDGLPGVCVDRYGDFATLSVSSDEAWERRGELAEHLVGLGARGVYLKVRVRADVRRLCPSEVAPPEPIAGERASAPLVVSEYDLRWTVALDQGLSTGLFVDQRENRRLVRDLAPGARVANLFCYTGAFTVAAARGGARHVTSVDLSRRALEVLRDNCALNGCDDSRHRIVRADVVDWLRRACRARERYDLVVLDPPTFGTRGRGTFSVSGCYRTVARDVLRLLAPGGRLLAVTNHRKTTLSAFRRLLHAAARDAGREIAQLKDLHSPLDCPPEFDGPLPSKGVLLTVV